VLQQASKDAYPELGKQFALKLRENQLRARLFPSGAGKILAQLLKDSPYDSQSSLAMATLRSVGDQQGLKQFY